MPSPKRLSTWIAALALSCTLVAAAHASPSASIEQVRNGQATAASTPAPAWATGNAGASNSHYLESHSLPYRVVMGDLPTDGTVIELVVAYNPKRSGSYAIDYLTHYQRVLPHVMFSHSGPETFQPLAGVTGVSATVSSAPIPAPTKSLVVDPDGAESEPASAQPQTSMAALSAGERAMTLFGGTLIDVTYVTEGDVTLATTSSETQVKIRFTADSPKAVLSWGGHIACRWDWGFHTDGTPRSAGGISGSSYHMALVGWNLGSLGSQDRSMSTDAVYPVPHCGVSNAGPFCANTTNTHTAPTGMESYSWSLVDNTSGAAIVGSSTGTSVSVSSGTGGHYIIVLTTGASGFTKQCQATVTVNAPAWANAGLDQTVCATGAQLTLDGSTGAGSGSWTGGAGSFNPSRNVMNAIYTPTAAELTAGSVTLTLNCPGTGSCGGASDQVKLDFQKAATANAGADIAVCATAPQAQLAGQVGGGATTGAWSGGAGSFSPSAAAMNAVYTPTAAEIAAGSVTLTLTSDATGGPCAQVSDQVTIAIHPAATVNAGTDLEVCSTSPQSQLAGNVGGGATSGAWVGGAGSFNPGRSALNAVYTPTAAEITAGGVTLTLTTNDPAGPCGALSDQVRIDIRPAAIVNAGLDLAACSSSPQVQLAGSVSGGASSGTWSGGNGDFSPNASALNATYLPTAAEIAAGGVTLTLTTDDPAGPCGALTDQVTIAISPVATVNAGANFEVCSTSPQAQLAGQVGGGASSGTWSGGAGSFSPNASTLNAIYTPTAAEIAAGSVTLTLTTNDPAGPCGALSDQVRIDIRPAAIVNAGLDLSVCSSSPQAQLAGSVSGGASSGSWTGGAGSFNPGRNALNAIYTPSAAEIAAGTVTLTLTSTAVQGSCPQVSDAVTISILPAATVSAGTDRDVCSTSPDVQLAGAIGGGATSALWSGGNGTFSPGITALNATYTPSAAEIAAGSVTLTLTTNDPAGPCGALADQVRINIRPAAIVNAGADLASCSSSPKVQLAGSVSGGASNGTWSGGNGTYSPNASTLNAQYTPSAAEIAAGSVTLTLTAAGSGPCPAVSDQVTIVISAAVSVNAGPDQITCPVSPQIQLAGVLGNGAVSGTWSGGSGTFQPNASALDAIYTLSAAEMTAGSVTLTLTTNDPTGPCPAVTDAMKITVSRPSVTVASKSTCYEITTSQMCANVSGGVPPYTFRWNTGATTACIAVADTGDYTVTITDSKGCQDVATGHFGHRDCAGMIAHTNTTCQSYMDGNAAPILPEDLNMNVNNGVINNIAPGVFFYFSIFTAPSSSFRVDIAQQTCPGFRTIEVQQAQVSLYDANCSGISGGQIAADGQAFANITGATPGQAYVISVKYSLKSLVGMALPDGAGCRYEFITKVNGVEVDRDPEGLQIGAVQPILGGSTPPSGGNGDPGDDGETIIQRGGDTEPVRLAPPAVAPDTTASGAGETGGDETAVQRNDSRDTPRSQPGPAANPNPNPGSGAGEPGSDETLIQRDGSRDGSRTPPGPATGPATNPKGETGTRGGAQPAASSGSGVASGPMAQGVALERPTPNPFRDAMRMSYAIAQDGTDVEIDVFDLAGRRMKSLASGTRSAGVHAVEWDGRDESGAKVRRGMYFVHVRIGHEARQVRVAFVN